MSFGARIGRPAPTATRVTCAVDAEEGQLEPAGAFGGGLETGGERRGERGERGGDVLFPGDRLGEAALGDEGRRRPARADRLLVVAKRQIEPANETDAEAGGKRGAGRVEDLADLLQADAVHGEDGFGIEAQRGERQRRQQIGDAAFRDDGDG